VDKVLSKKVDKELNQDTSLREDHQEGGYDRTGAALFDGIMGSKLGSSNVELPAAYHFKGTLTYEIVSEDEDEPMEITYLFPKEEEATLGFTTSAQSDQYFVWDLDRDVFVLYTLDKDGNQSIMKLPAMINEQIEAEAAEEETDFTFEKTGRSKTILGYACSEYKMISDDTEVLAWIATDFPYQMGSFYSLMAQQAKNNSMSVLKENGGMALEIITFTGDKREETHMLASSYSEEVTTFDNSGQ